MYEALRKKQRRTVRSDAYISHTYLAMPEAGHFVPLGSITHCLETLQIPGRTVVRGPFSRTLMLTVLLEGNLSIATGSQEPAAVSEGQVAAIVPTDGESIQYRSTQEKSARYLEVGLGLSEEAATCEVGTSSLEKGFSRSGLAVLVSGQGHEDSLQVPVDCALYEGRLRAGENLIFETLPDRTGLLLLIRGLLRVGHERLMELDALQFRSQTSVDLFAQQASRFFLFDVP